MLGVFSRFPRVITGSGTSECDAPRNTGTACQNPKPLSSIFAVALLPQNPSWLRIAALLVLAALILAGGAAADTGYSNLFTLDLQSGATANAGYSNPFTLDLRACVYALNPPGPVEVVADGATGQTFQVQTNAVCGWAATSGVSWVRVTAGASGAGNGTVTYSVDPTSSTSARTGTITAGGQTLTVNQAGQQIRLSNGHVAVEVSWRSQYTGETGIATALPQADGFAYFYFSSPDNPEVFVKVLDFGISSPYLVFYAGLTDYEFTVTFTNVATGKKLSFTKPPGSFAGGANNQDLPHVIARAAYWSRGGEWSKDLKGASTVLVDKRSEPMPGQWKAKRLAATSELLLSKGHVAVSVSWRSQYDGQAGQATPLPQKDEFGYFYFSDANNPEVFVKVLDFGASSPYLIFYAGLTDYEYTVTYRNVQTGQSISFKKEPGSFNGGADNSSLKH